MAFFNRAKIVINSDNITFRYVPVGNAELFLLFINM